MTPITPAQLTALYAKQGTPVFYVALNDSGNTIHFHIKALNADSLYAQLLVLLPNFGITQFWILDEAGTVLLRDANLKGVIDSVGGPLKHRIEAAKANAQAIEAAMLAQQRGRG